MNDNNNNNNRDKNNNNIHSVRLPERISSMKFFPVINNNNMARLYVATVERVFIWEVSTLSKTINEEKRNDSDLGPRTTILEQYIEKDAMAISAKANYFAVSLGKNVVIYDTETHAPTCRLEGHFGTINAMTFFTPHADHVLITVGDVLDPTIVQEMSEINIVNDDPSFIDILPSGGAGRNIVYTILSMLDMKSVKY
jgi:WD40 repeat protein